MQQKLLLSSQESTDFINISLFNQIGRNFKWLYRNKFSMKKKGSEQLIVKPIEYPHQALQLEALLSRIRTNHPNISLINQDYQRKLAGYRGEKAVDFPLSFCQMMNTLFCMIYAYGTENVFFKLMY